MNESRVVMYDEIGKLISQTLSNVEQRLKIFDRMPCGVYAVPRGGYPLGLAISHYFDLPMLSHVADNCIIADDIFDSGATIQAISKYSKPLLYAAIFYNNKRCIISDTSADLVFAEKTDGVWIVFPWESETK